MPTVSVSGCARSRRCARFGGSFLVVAFAWPIAFAAFVALAGPIAIAWLATAASAADPPSTADGHAFYESYIRPLLIERCYECHSEAEQASMGGLLLDRRRGWIDGGDTQQAVVPGQVDESLLIRAVRYNDEDYQMPPDGPLEPEQVALLEQWVRMGAPGAATEIGETEFSRLGDQEFLLGQASDHWAFQPIRAPSPRVASSANVPSNAEASNETRSREPSSDDVPDQDRWNASAIDRFVFDAMQRHDVRPAHRASPHVLLKRLHHDLTGLMPTADQVDSFARDYRAAKRPALVVARVVDELLASPRFGEHWGRLWLDLVRYADTDSNYRADTKTPHYFPYAFSYRDYVIDAINDDKPYDAFLKEQFAADLMGFGEGDAEIAALGFFAVGPHRSRASTEALDDWIDVTTRGLMGMTVACARCHDHKFEPIPTTDYYALRGIFNNIERSSPLVVSSMVPVQTFVSTPSQRADYRAKAAVISKKIAAAGDAKKKGNNRPIGTLLRETELAQLMLFHPGGPGHAMVVRDKKKFPAAFVAIRGELGDRGERVQRRFLTVLDPDQRPFPPTTSGRLELAERIASADNPLTARVWVNRVWGKLIGAPIVATPSDFGLQGAPPTHPQLLEYLASDFLDRGWSTKQIVRQIVCSETYQQSCHADADTLANDPDNRWLTRAHRKRLSIEALRDRALSVSGQLDLAMHGRPGLLWPDPGGEKATGDVASITRRRTIYGFVNRFNLDPNLRTFDFPSPMASAGERAESIVAPQSLFLLNSPFVIEQADAIANSREFAAMPDDDARVAFLFRRVLARTPDPMEVRKVKQYLDRHTRFVAKVRPSPRMRDQPWPLVAQALLMSNEFQTLD